MSDERKKLLWISISAAVVVLILVAAGFFLFTPKGGKAAAPATIGNSAPPKAQDPQDFLAAPLPTPSAAPEQPASPGSDMIVVYGDKPTLPQAAGSATAPSGNGRAGAGAGPNAGATTGSSGVASGSGGPSAESEGSGAGSAGTESPTIASKPADKLVGSTKTATAKSSSAAKAGAKKAATKASVTTVEEYWIQAASFSSRGRADELKSGLAEKGLAALISVKDISGKSWYRVRIGPYTTKAEADGWLARLKGIEGCKEAYVAKAVSHSKD